MVDQYELSIVVPAYNEKKNLPLLLEKYKERKKDLRFQLVVVDNGSTDGTGDFLLEKVQEKGYEFIKIVTIKKNIGYGYGIHQGLKHCGANIIGWSHADFQCSPEDVFKGYELFQKSNNSLAFVKGNRVKRSWKPLILTYGLQIYSSILLLTLFDDINGQPKIFHKELLKTFIKPPKGFSYDLYVQYKAIKNKYFVSSFKVYFEKRLFGVSKAGFNILSKSQVIKKYLIDVIKILVGKIK